MTLSLVSSVYLAHGWPYKKRVQNYLSMFNEMATLEIAYLVMVLVGISEEAQMKEAVGQMISIGLYATWTVNFLMIIAILFI